MAQQHRSRILHGLCAFAALLSQSVSAGHTELNCTGQKNDRRSFSFNVHVDGAEGAAQAEYSEFTRNGKVLVMRSYHSGHLSVRGDSVSAQDRRFPIFVDLLSSTIQIGQRTYSVDCSR